MKRHLLTLAVMSWCAFIVYTTRTNPTAPVPPTLSIAVSDPVTVGIVNTASAQHSAGSKTAIPMRTNLIVSVEKCRVSPELEVAGMFLS